jgi:cytochrome c553
VENRPEALVPKEKPMKRVFLLLPILSMSLALGVQEVAYPPDKPTWAYAVAPGTPVRGAGPAGVGRGAGGARGPGRGAPDPTKYTLPGSRSSFTLAEVRNAFGPADWFPEDHPPMPDVVAHGRSPNARACGFCHMPNGKGRPENSPLAGFPKDYIVRQLKEFANGTRDTAEPRKPKDMLQIAQNISEGDMEQAGQYFSSMSWTPWIRVVETDSVKHTRVAGQMFHLIDDGTTEPIGNRIVEVSENEEQEQLRAPRTGFIAYVPTGSIARGAVLVTSGGSGKTLACVTCHGPDLKGVASIPGLVNRSPSYLGRQLYDFKVGTRNGSMAPLMKPVVQNLTAAEMVDILAYVASLKP